MVFMFIQTTANVVPAVIFSVYIKRSDTTNEDKTFAFVVANSHSSLSTSAHPLSALLSENGIILGPPLCSTLPCAPLIDVPLSVCVV